MLKKLNLKNRFEFVFNSEFGINISRMLYSIAILFLFLYVILEKIFPVFPGDAGVRRIFSISGVYDKVDSFSLLIDGWYIMILPALVLLVFFTALFFILKCHSSRKKLIPFVIKSYIITVIFSFITLKFSYLSGTMSYMITSFSEVSFSQVFGFMFIYSVPISISVIVNNDDKEDFLKDIFIFILLILCANIPLLVSKNFSIGSFLFALHELGIFYFLALLISLLSILDYFGADLDTGPASFLIYLGLPTYIVLTVMGFIFVVLYMGINALFGNREYGFEIIAPFTQLYYYLKHLIYYKDIPGLIFSLLSLSAIAQGAMTLYKKGSEAGSMDWDLSQRFRSFLGVAALSYFLSINLTFPWWIITTTLFTGMIITVYMLIKKKVYFI